MPPPKSDLSAYCVERLLTDKGTTIPFVYIKGSSSVTLLYSHGNAEDLGDALRFVRGFLATLGVSVCCYEYSGYGQSTGGGPSEAHVYADIEAAFKRLVFGHRVAPEDIIVAGRSLGTGPSTFLAAKYPKVRGLVLISALASVYRVTLPMHMQTLPGDAFCSIDRIKQVKAPLLLLHGTGDKLTSTEHANALAEMAGSPVTTCCLLSGATHGNIVAVGWRHLVEAELRRFISEIGDPRRACSSPSKAAVTRRIVFRYRDKGPTMTCGSRVAVGQDLRCINIS